MIEPAQEHIRRILKGDTESFRHIISAYEKLVRHVIGGLVRNSSDEYELSQEVFVKAYQNLKSFRMESKFSTWIARIAQNTALNHLSKKKAGLYEDMAIPAETDESFLDRYVDNASDTTDDMLLEKDRSRWIQKAIEKLPSPYSDILILYHMEEMSYLEIGETLKMPEGTVKNYLFRARKKMKDYLVKGLRQEAVHL